LKYPLHHVSSTLSGPHGLAFIHAEENRSRPYLNVPMFCILRGVLTEHIKDRAPNIAFCNSNGSGLASHRFGDIKLIEFVNPPLNLRDRKVDFIRSTKFTNFYGRRRWLFFGHRPG
jgi:hypothetical protein